ncbi:Intermediate cleaving peptidase 55 [Hypsizygus marmoreus]|uniref:Intermediate cleaving peptidase 55 n=1 Tax=Hypsizygus marmoreus TaxID=39966 RepID=A0A369J2T3_HYPMA|nr:Intermediate cleaving peptidase 55 [Hypsizygus marmoreus]
MSNFFRTVSTARRALLRTYGSRRRYATEATNLSDGSLKPSIYGQPLFQSHPHLLQPQDLTPGIPAEDYELRRRQLMNGLPDNSLVVCVAAPIKYMSGKIFYKYRQASDFWYLTGFEEPDSAIILEKTSSSRGYRMTIFCSGKDSAKEKWEGAKTSLQDAATIFRADDARPIDNFSSHLKSAMAAHTQVYVDVPHSHTRRGPRASSKSILKYLSPPSDARSEYDFIVDSLSSAKRKPLAPQVAKLRAIKSGAEQGVMRAAADISGRVHAKTMRFTRPGIPEAALAAHFEYLCALSGAQRMAYVPVVASGPNALIIHYTSNNHLVRQDEMVLIDAGCEYNGYASDITRTYPASGTFTPPQRELYAAVLAAQKELVALCTESADLSLHALHRLSCDYLRRELKQLGFELTGGDLESMLYPHFLSHPIGIDLHESSNFDRSQSLKAGMVVTIEPGIYVPPTANFPKHYHNIGIRIEDEVLVGKTHPTVLSVAAPKEIVDVEGACQGSLGLEAF